MDSLGVVKPLGYRTYLTLAAANSDTLPAVSLWAMTTLANTL